MNENTQCLLIVFFIHSVFHDLTAGCIPFSQDLVIIFHRTDAHDDFGNTGGDDIHGIDGLVESLLPAWAPGYGTARGTDVFTLRRLVEAGDVEGMRDIIMALFASIPYTRDDDPFENYFQAVLWLVFALLGRYVCCETRQARGRVDVVIEARAHIYVIELKRDGTAAEALAQIEEKGYAEPFAADSRALHLIGCAFDSKTRLLTEWEERPGA